MQAHVKASPPPPSPAKPLRGAAAQQGVPTVGCGVEVRLSTLPGAGNGLFASQHFERGDLVTEYVGQVISHQEAQELRLLRAHTHVRVLDMRHAYIDGLKRPLQGEGGGSFANDARGAAAANCAYDTRFDRYTARSRVYLRALRAISPGEEVFVSYGSHYWQSFEAASPSPPQPQKAKAAGRGPAAAAEAMPGAAAAAVAAAGAAGAAAPAARQSARLQVRAKQQQELELEWWQQQQRERRRQQQPRVPRAQAGAPPAQQRAAARASAQQRAERAALRDALRASAGSGKGGGGGRDPAARGGSPVAGSGGRGPADSAQPAAPPARSGSKRALALCGLQGPAQARAKRPQLGRAPQQQEGPGHKGDEEQQQHAPRPDWAHMSGGLRRKPGVRRVSSPMLKQRPGAPAASPARQATGGARRLRQRGAPGAGGGPACGPACGAGDRLRGLKILRVAHV